MFTSAPAANRACASAVLPPFTAIMKSRSVSEENTKTGAAIKSRATTTNAYFITHLLLKYSITTRPDALRTNSTLLASVLGKMGQ